MTTQIITPVSVPIKNIVLEPGSVLTITDITWEKFEATLEELGEKRSARIAYSNGVLGATFARLRTPQSHHWLHCRHSVRYSKPRLGRLWLDDLSAQKKSKPDSNPTPVFMSEKMQTEYEST